MKPSRRTTASPSVSRSSASIPSIDVPLIRPIARRIFRFVSGLLIATFLCMVRPSRDQRHNRSRPALFQAVPMTDIDFTPKSDFLNVMLERGYVHQCSDFAGLDALAAKGELTTYVGYDCTAPSLHVGHLISIMMMHWLQQSGNKPIALMGGGTTRVGDP